MSGSNPFRRSRIIAASETSSAVPNDDAIAPVVNIRQTGNLDKDVQPQLLPHPKTVRIATPPIPSPAADSTSYFPAAPRTTTTISHNGSPPPELSGSESPDDFKSDPFNPHSSATDHDGGHIESNGLPRHPTSRPPAQGSTRPNNPVSRQSITEDLQSRVAETGVGSSEKNNTTLDVDAFTRLLLTGSADGLSDTKKAATVRVDSASDTRIRFSTETAEDSSSSSSDVETTLATQQGNFDSVVTSNTSTSLPSLKAESNDIERTASLKKPRPPPPKTRHGKPIRPEESAQSSRKSSAEVSASGPSHQHAIPAQTSVTLPPDSYDTSLAVSDVKSPSSISDAGTSDDVSSLHRASSQSKRPPTPPLTRRHSQIKPGVQLSREHPNRISLPPKGLGLQLSGPSSPGTRTPPRPPSRRYEKPSGGSQIDSVSQPKSSLSQEQPDPSSSLTLEGPPSTSPSSAPSRRSSVKRTPSGSASSGQAMPPPPPPPRRLRASSKGSHNSILPAEKVVDQDENTLPSSSHAEDILADLSRLQREVDDLRGHYENRRVS